MKQNNKIHYHQQTLSLLEITPRISSQHQLLLKNLEDTCGFRLPVSVKEWYSFEESISLLAEYSNQDNPVDLEDLGKSEGDGTPCDFISNKLLLILRENQGAWDWAVKIDGSEDPPVLVTTVKDSEVLWELFAESFSTFVYTRAWDWRWPKLNWVLSAIDQPLSTIDLAFLRANFTEGPRTYNRPAPFTYRFYNDSKQILILTDNNEQSDWYLWSDYEDNLLELTRLICNCGTLSTTLESVGCCDTKILEILRSQAK